MTDIEEWKTINGYNGTYLVSNHGRVMTDKGKVLKPFKLRPSPKYPNSSNNSSGLRGVSKRGREWRVTLEHEGKCVLDKCAATKRETAALMYIGALAEIDEEDAANARVEPDAYEAASENSSESSSEESSEESSEDILGAM